MRWTNDKWVSTIHRVVNPPEEIPRNVDRMSIAFFFVPDHDAEVRGIDSCMGPDNPARYAPITAKDESSCLKRSALRLSASALPVPLEKAARSKRQLKILGTESPFQRCRLIERSWAG